MNKFALALIAFLLPLQSFSQTHPSAESTQPFAFDFYKMNAKVKGNLFFSPLSIEAALAMTAAGAQEETLKQILATLHLGGDSHAEFKSLLSQLKGNQDYQLFIANRIWAQKGSPYYPNFLNLLIRNYNADLIPLDFKKQTESSRLQINKWVEQQTHDKIKDLLKPGMIQQTTDLVLTNAIYFKGSWAQPFEKSLTRNDQFQASVSQKNTVPFMHMTTNLNYFENSELQYLQLPYKGQELVMQIILPKAGVETPNMEQKMNPQLFSQLAKLATFNYVSVSLPKFKAESEFELVPTLSLMGMPIAFDPSKANFRGMRKLKVGENLFISAVVHKAFVDVNEVGTEAAAATAVGMAIASSIATPPPPPKIFKADHPFLFYISHAKTGTILFMGRYSQP